MRSPHYDNRRTREQVENSRSLNRRCWACGVVGHLYAECPNIEGRWQSRRYNRERDGYRRTYDTAACRHDGYYQDQYDRYGRASDDLRSSRHSFPVTNGSKSRADSLSWRSSPTRNWGASGYDEKYSGGFGEQPQSSKETSGMTSYSSRTACRYNPGSYCQRSQ